MSKVKPSNKPVQLDSIVTFKGAANSNSISDEYILKLLNGSNEHSSIGIKYLNSNAVTEQIETVSYVDVADSIPVEHSEAVRNLNDKLLEFIAVHYPLENGEHIDEHFLSVLTKDSRLAGKGSLVYERRTNLSNTQFLFPHILFDVSTFKPSVSFNQVETQMEVLDLAPVANAKAKSLIINWSKQIAKGIAGKALPKPYGDAAVFMFNLLEGLFSSPDKDAITLRQVIDELKEYIDHKFEQEKVQEKLEHVQELLTWLDDKAPSLDLPFEKLGSDYLNDFTEKLRNAVGSGSDSIHAAITLLSEPKYTEKAEYFDVLILAISAYCSALSTLVNIYLLKAENDGPNKDNHLNTAKNFAMDFANFIGGGKSNKSKAQFIKGLIAKKIQDRVDLVKVEFKDERETRCYRTDIGPMECITIGKRYWQFYEDPSNEKGKHRKEISYWTSGCCNDQHDDSDKIKKDVVQERDAYVTETLRPQLDKSFEIYIQTVEDWEKTVRKLDGILAAKQVNA